MKEDRVTFRVALCMFVIVGVALAVAVARGASYGVAALGAVYVSSTLSLLRPR